MTEYKTKIEVVVWSEAANEKDAAKELRKMGDSEILNRIVSVGKIAALREV